MDKKQFKKLQHKWYGKLKKSGFNDIENGMDYQYPNKQVEGNRITYDQVADKDVVRSFYENVAFYEKVLEFKKRKMAKFVEKSDEVNKDLYDILCVMLYKGFTLGRMQVYLKKEYKIKKSFGTIQKLVKDLYNAFEKDPIFKNVSIIKLNNNSSKLSKEPWDICQCCGRKYLIEYEEKSTYDFCEDCVDEGSH